MQRYKYEICSRTNTGTEDEPVMVESFATKTIPATEENEALAKAEAYNGIYTIVDDGQPEPATDNTAEEQLDEMAAAIERGLTT